jgi:D-alanyl-lipoteichoic acid acyltransferase DltB (MBOAT superfamily)
MLYLLVMLLFFVAVVPFVIVGEETKRKLKKVFILAVAILVAKLSHPGAKGTALRVYTTAGFPGFLWRTPRRGALLARSVWL